MPIVLDATTGSHLGDRAEQQDRIAIIPSRIAPGTVLAVLADGAGGYTGGAAAAQQVIATATSLFERFTPKTDAVEQLLADIVEEAHTVIKLNRVLTEEEPHSTFVALVLQPDRADWAHVGDSRLYHFREAALQWRTPDHSIAEQMIREGKLTEATRRTFRNRNILLQALGGADTPMPTLGGTRPLRPGDTFLLCSDGLWDYFTDAELGQALAALPPRKTAEMLIGAARVRSKGRGDNVSVIIIKLTEAPAKLTAEPAKA